MSHAQPMKTAGRLLAGGLVAITVAFGASCAAGGDGSSGAPGKTLSARERVAVMLAGHDSGLMITQWRVTDDPAVVADALMRYARGGEGAGGDPVARRALEQNGFRLVRVAADDTEALLEELGGSSVDVDGWHGQAYEWRALAAKSVGPAGRAVAVDGHVRRLSGGRVRLMMRGWTTQMEDGPFVYLELQPDFDQSRRSRLTHVLARPRFVGERFDSMGLELMLETGYAYVLTTAGPAEDWSASARAGASGVSGGGAAADGAKGSSRPRVGPGVERAAATPTVGEVLLRTDAIPSRRDVLVFVPKIPAALYPAPRSTPAETGAAR